MPDPIFDSAFLSMCMTWRHDFGLLDRKEQMNVKRLLLPLYEHHVKPLQDKIDFHAAEVARLTGERDALAPYAGHAEELEKTIKGIAGELGCHADEEDICAAIQDLTAERDAAVAAKERAESCLRSLDPYFEFSSLPNGAEGFVVAGDAAGLTEVFAEAASILFGDHIADALAQAEKVKS